MSRPEYIRKKYEALIVPLREAARAHGYALAVHGTLARDIDLVAIPWTGAAVAPRVLAEALREVAAKHNDGVAFPHPKERSEFFENGCPGAKPHGRLAWSIHLGGTYIDLSVMPPRPEL